MHWQDLVFTFGQIIFVVALIPTIKGKDKPAFITSLITGAVLLSFTTAYFALALYFSALMSTIMSASWFLLAFQKYKTSK